MPSDEEDPKDNNPLNVFSLLGSGPDSEWINIPETSVLMANAFFSSLVKYINLEVDYRGNFAEDQDQKIMLESRMKKELTTLTWVSHFYNIMETVKEDPITDPEDSNDI